MTFDLVDVFGMQDDEGARRSHDLEDACSLYIPVSIKSLISVRGESNSGLTLANPSAIRALAASVNRALAFLFDRSHHLFPTNGIRL
jgi:hypothetical protein